jgi:hypothetical protein
MSVVLEVEGLRPVSDDSWKVFISPAWLKVEGHSSGRDFIEVYDSVRDPANWKQPGFNDTRWAATKVVPADQAFYDAHIERSTPPLPLGEGKSGQYIKWDPSRPTTPVTPERPRAKVAN